MTAFNYQSTISKMFSNRILCSIVSLLFWASLRTRYCDAFLLEKSAEVILSPMNTSIDPCEDFYGFACGSYAQNVSARSDPITITKDSMYRNLSNFLEMNSSSSDPRILQKARTLYRSCMANNTVYRNQSIKSLADALQQVGLPVTPPLFKASDNFSYGYTMARSKVLFNMNFFIEPTLWQENSTHVSLFLTKPTHKVPFSFSNQPVPSIKTPNKTYTGIHELFLQYARVMTKMMYVHANETVPNLTSAELNSTFENLHLLDMFLEYVTTTTSRKDHEARMQNSPKLAMTFASLGCKNKQILPKDQFDWPKYIGLLMGDTPGMSIKDEIKSWDGSYMNVIFSWIVCEMSPQERELYMWWRTVVDLVPFSAIVDFDGRDLWCAEEVNLIFPQATALMLVNNCDMLRTITKVGSMAEDIRDAFNSTITDVSWMNQTEKDRMSERLMDMTVCVGYPLWLTDSRKVNKFHEKYDKVNLDETDFLTNLQKLVQVQPRIRNSTQMRERTSEGCNFDSLDVNCFYSGARNRLAIQAGYLQFPFYGHVLPALDFGSIGTAIGHEMSHGFDSYRMESLKMFDEDDTAGKEYSRRVQCFLDHFREYSNPNTTRGTSPTEIVLLGHARYSNITASIKAETLADQTRTVDENLSDSNGLKVAFNAYKDYSRKYGSEPAPLGLEKYSNDQLFFIAYASKFCSSYSPSSFTDSTDVHSPHSVRVLASLKNSEDFAKAWGCRKGSSMNPCGDKCEIWS